jgi:hypothetical protein
VNARVGNDDGESTMRQESAARLMG